MSDSDDFMKAMRRSLIEPLGAPYNKARTLLEQVTRSFEGVLGDVFMGSDDERLDAITLRNRPSETPTQNDTRSDDDRSDRSGEGFSTEDGRSAIRVAGDTSEEGMTDTYRQYLQAGEVDGVTICPLPSRSDP